METLGLREERKIDLGLTQYAQPQPGTARVLSGQPEYRTSEPGSPQAEAAIAAVVKKTGRRPFEVRADQANLATTERQGGTPMRPRNQARERAFMERHLVDAMQGSLRSRMGAIVSKPNRAVRDFDAAQGEGIFIDRPALRTKR